MCTRTGDVAKEEGFIEVASVLPDRSSRADACKSGLANWPACWRTIGILKAKKKKVLMCLNWCGHIHKGNWFMEVCPVCRHERGYFIPFSKHGSIFECVFIK